MFSVIKQTASIAPVSSKLARNFGATAVQLKKRDPSVPTVPKDPASSYTLFVKDWFPANRAQHAGPEGKFDMKTIASAMGSAWTALTDTDKQSYADKAKELRKTFESDYKKWYTALDKDAIKSIEAATGKKLPPPGGKKAKKVEDLERPGNPGRPLTAFFEFLKEYRGGEGQGMSMTDTAKSAGEKWREMSDDEKKPYRDSAAEGKSKYVEWQKTLQ